MSNEVVKLVWSLFEDTGAPQYYTLFSALKQKDAPDPSGDQPRPIE